MRLFTAAICGTALSTCPIGYDVSGSSPEEISLGDNITWGETLVMNEEVHYPEIVISPVSTLWYMSQNEQRAMKKALYKGSKIIT